MKAHSVVIAAIAAVLSGAGTLSCLAQSEIVPVPTKKQKAAAAVRVVGVEREVAKCKYLTDVRASEIFFGGGWGNISMDITMDKMKRRVAEAGGNTLFMIGSNSNMGSTSAMGIAYKC